MLRSSWLAIFAMVSIGTTAAHAQQGTITGQVLDAQTMRPLVAVQVFIPQLSIGVLSNRDGTFTLINVPAGQVQVRAQLLGYRTTDQQVTVGAGETMRISFNMASDVLALDELIVTGTAGGTQRRAVGNVVERVGVAEQIELAAPSSVTDLFNSRAPGLAVQATTSGVGSASRIRIRGSSSTSLSNDPIIYVDGVRIFSERTVTGLTQSVGRMNDINPEDIESIEVIKGPAAATLYGTEASGGVIQIITKRGASGVASWDASATYGLNYIPREWPHTLYGQNAAGDLLSVHLIEQDIADGFGDPFQKGPIQRYNLSVSGGTDILRYFASLGRSDEEGFTSWNWENRTTARLSLATTIRERLNLTLNTSYLTGESRVDAPVYGQIVWGNARTRASVGGSNDPRRGYRDRPPEAHRDLRFDINGIDRAQWSLEVSHQPLEWLRNRLVFGMDYAEAVRDLTFLREENAPRGFWGLSGLGSRDLLRDQTRFTTIDYSGSATIPLTDQVSSQSSIGFQYYNKDRWILQATDQDYASSILRTVGTGASSRAVENLIENASVGVYFQQQFDLNQRVFLTGAVRADDNSAFGENFDAAIYPKFSGTWVLHEEPFWRLPQLEEFRVRTAWGMAGQQPDAFAADRLYNAVPGPDGQSILTPLAYGNPDLGPEKGQELEVGFDAGFLGGRVSLAYTQYWKKTKDAIIAQGVAHSIGFPGTQLLNIGQTSNWGKEAILDLQLLRLDRAQLNWTFNLSTMHNRLDEIGEGVETLGLVRRARSHVRGFPLASQFEYVVLSADFVSGNSGRVTNIMCDGGTGPNNRLPGGSPVPCAQAKMLYLGPGEPTWQLGWVQSLTLGRNWQLRANVHAEGGYYSMNEGMAGAHTTQRSTLASIQMTDPIFVAHTQAPLRREMTGMYRNDFARLREVALQYALPSDWAQKFGASRASVTLAGRNMAYLWTRDTHAMFGGLEIYDWEMGTGSEEFGGESQASDPSMASATINVRVTF